MSTSTGLLASKYAINKPTTTSSPAENMANITFSSSKKSWADVWDEDSEESTTSGQDSNNTTDCESTSSNKQPASTKHCASMLKSRWADANYECKGAQTRAEYSATNGTTTTTKQSPSKNKLSTSTNKPAAKESTEKWDTPTYYGSTTTTTTTTTTTKQPVGMLKSRWSTTTEQPATTTTTSSSSSSSTSSSSTTSSTTTKTTTPPTPTESKQPVDDKPAPGMLKSRWADDTHEYKGCQTRAEYRATHNTNNNKPRRR